MIKSHFVNEEIVTTGRVLAGDLYPDYCCYGFDWEASLVFFGNDEKSNNSIWGACHNPDCQEYDGADELDPYRGVSHILQDDFEESLAIGKPRFAVEQKIASS